MNDGARNRLVLVGCVAALVGAVVLVRLLLDGPLGRADKDRLAGGGSGMTDLAVPVSFTIGGNASDPLSPGVMAPLDLELTNPHGADLSVTDVRVRVRGLTAPHADALHPCTVDDFVVRQISLGSAITVTAGAAQSLSSLGLPRTAWPKVGMLNRSVNQDGCKGASVALAYTASGSLGR